METNLNKPDPEKINFRIKLIELFVITITSFSVIQSIKRDINLSISLFFIFLSIIVVILSLGLDKFIEKKEITQKCNTINIKSKFFNFWDLIIFILYLLSIIFLIINLISFKDFIK